MGVIGASAASYYDTWSADDLIGVVSRTFKLSEFVHGPSRGYPTYNDLKIAINGAGVYTGVYFALYRAD